MDILPSKPRNLHVEGAGSGEGENLQERQVVRRGNLQYPKQYLIQEPRNHGFLLNVRPSFRMDRFNRLNRRNDTNETYWGCLEELPKGRDPRDSG